MIGEVVPFPSPSSEISPESALEVARTFRGLPPNDRHASIGAVVGQSETLLSLCQLLDAEMDSDPSTVLRDADEIYESVRSSSAAKQFLFDEREYYLGELALLAGTACRVLGLRDDARSWFDRAEAWFLLTVNASGDVARLSYQRLAAKLEERQFSEILVLAPALSEAFARAGAKENALKCRYLEAVAFRELDSLSEALSAFESVIADAKELSSTKVLGPALVTAIQIHCDLGETNLALTLAAEAAPFLRATNNRVSLAKLQWGLANLLRQKGRIAESIESFRIAQTEFTEIGLRADVAALHLIVGDMLLETGQDRQAEWEIRAALPIIDELKMVPEGFAAMSLLRESVRRRSIDRQALRKLHGYFEEASS